MARLEPRYLSCHHWRQIAEVNGPKLVLYAGLVTTGRHLIWHGFSLGSIKIQVINGNNRAKFGLWYICDKGAQGRI